MRVRQEKRHAAVEGVGVEAVREKAGPVVRLVLAARVRAPPAMPAVGAAIENVVGEVEAVEVKLS
jgi:hypothetical protein